MKAQDLKKSVLQLAIQGKLVEQNPNDEPASVLLEKIKAEKAALIKDGKIKKDKAASFIYKATDGTFYENINGVDKDISDELPFDIPDSWTWVRLGTIGSWGAGATPNRSNPKYYNGDIPWLKTGDLNDGFVFNIPEKISKKAVQETTAKVKPIGSVLMAMYGATIGKLGILAIEAATNQACCACVPFCGVFNKYLFFFLLSHRKAFIEQSFGGAQPNISKEKILPTLMPLPPSAEQKRIVAKIEELMPLIAEYDTAETALTALNTAFPEQMKKSILQQAIQGKLVEQRAEEGTAAELYKQIQAEKQKLIKEGKIKKDKPLPPITEDEIPFDIPDSWMWVRLGNILNLLTDGTHKTPHYIAQGVPFISVKDISSGFISFDNTKFISEEEANELNLRCNPEKGDLLLSKVGTTGIPAPVDTDIKFSLFVSVALLKFSKVFLNREYLIYAILSPCIQIQCAESTKGVGNKNWVMRDISNTLLPLPPLAEQKRIVAKIEELMQYCKELRNYNA